MKPIFFGIYAITEKHNTIRYDTIRYDTIPKNFDCSISSKLKTTVFTRSVFIFSKLSYFNLNFGVKQSKIG